MHGNTEDLFLPERHGCFELGAIFQGVAQTFEQGGVFIVQHLL
jgi:hypothetical protein